MTCEICNRREAETTVSYMGCSDVRACQECAEWAGREQEQVDLDALEELGLL